MRPLHSFSLVSLLALCVFITVGCGDDDRPRRDADVAMDTSVENPDTSTGCVPGQGACAGNVHYTCGPDGMSMVDPVTCPSACNPTEGCVDCTPGQRRCEGSVSMICASDGSGFVTGRDCAENGATCGGAGFCTDSCGAAESSRSNIGCEYWPTPLFNSSDFEGRYDFRAVVANPNSEVANVRVFRGATMISSAAVPPNGLQDIVLPWVPGQNDRMDDPFVSFGATNGAYRLISDRPVTVAQFNPFDYDNGRTIDDFLNPRFGEPDYSYTNDASLLLPAHSFTGDYIASSFSPLSRAIEQMGLFGVERSAASIPGYIAVVGTTPEPTQVDITLTAPIAADVSGRFPAATAGTTISFSIARGEVIHVMAAAPPACAAGRPGFVRREFCPDDMPGCGTFLEFCNEANFDLSGSRVRANHPIAVFGGHVCAYVPYDREACDHLENQMPPLQTWGTNYVTAPLRAPGSTAQNVVRVMAAFDATTVTIDPPQGGVSTLNLNAGGWNEFTASTPFRVSSDRGVMVTQYLSGQFSTDPPQAAGDPAMVVLVPREQFRSDYTFVTPTSYNASTMGQSYIMITRTPGQSVQLDGSDVSASWETVGDREVGIVSVGGGTHQLQASERVGVIVYGLGQFTSYAYPAGLNLEEILLI